MHRYKNIIFGCILILGVIVLTYLVIGNLIGAPSQEQPEPDNKKEPINPPEGNTLDLKLNHQDNQAVEPEDPAIIVQKAAICLNVKNRMPQGVLKTVTSDIRKIFCWGRILNANRKKVRYIWYLGGKSYPQRWIHITSNRFRTWSCIQINPQMIGPASVEVVDQTGRVLETIDFKVILRAKNYSRIRYSGF